MAILLTNDDGIEAEGINTLFNELNKIDKTYMVAPSGERSACSHSINLFQYMKLDKKDDRRFSLDSTPADCVRIASLGLIEDKIDLVVSGINRGANLGFDINYSGTVAGAREGVIQGKPGIAFSLCRYNADEEEFKAAAKSAAKIAEAVLKHEYEYHIDGVVLNVNFPEDHDESKVKVTRIGKRRYHDYIEKEERGDGTYIKIAGDFPESEMIEETDCMAVENGYISVSPISIYYNLPDTDLSFIYEALNG